MKLMGRQYPQRKVAFDMQGKSSIISSEFELENQATTKSKPIMYEQKDGSNQWHAAVPSPCSDSAIEDHRHFYEVYKQRMKGVSKSITVEA